MNHLTNTSSTPATSMTSREIAELTGKQHKHVLADIRTMLTQLGMTSAEFSANLPDSYGRLQAAIRLPKDLTLTLVSGYSIPMRHRIVTRWQELEAAQAPLPRTIGDLPRNSAIPGPVMRVLMDAKRIGHTIEDVMTTLADVLFLIGDVEKKQAEVAKLNPVALPAPVAPTAPVHRPIPKPTRIANGMVHLHRDHLLSVAEFFDLLGIGLTSQS